MTHAHTEYCRKLQNLLDETYGASPDSLFIKTKLHNKLTYPFPKYRLPLHYNERVELEPVYPLAKFLGPVRPYTPLSSAEEDDEGRKSAIVIGYREIFEKRERRTYLHWLATIDKEFWVLSVAPGGGRGGKGSSKSSSKTGQKGRRQVKPKKEASRDKKQKTPSEKSGSSKDRKKEKKGDKKDKDRKKDKRDKKDGKKDKGDKKAGNKDRRDKREGKRDKKDDKKDKKEKGDDKRRDKSGSKEKGDDKKRDKDSRDRSRELDVKKDRPKEAPSDAKRGGEDRKSVSYSRTLPDDLPDPVLKKIDQEVDKDMANPRGRASMALDTGQIETPSIDARFLKSKIPEAEDDWKEISFARRASSLVDESLLLELRVYERDNEWLSYSSTDSAELQEREEADQLYKQREPWMLRGITYESQHLVDALSWFLLSSKLTGRSSFYTRPDYLENIMVFVVDRGKEFVFLITSTILWLCFVLIAQAAVDILLVGGSSDYASKERNAVERYSIPCAYVIGELAIVAIWSVFLLLKYSLRVAHYINVWCTSASEMEVNLADGIVVNTIGNHISFLLYCIFIIVSFALGKPRNVRASMGVLTALLVRNFVPEVLEFSGSSTDAEKKLLSLQIFGLCIHIYVMYCARITSNLVHIMCIILRNATELWNLKFALRAGQIPVAKSGYLRHMRLRQTYLKAWQHHRLLTGLCLELGNVFAAPVVLNFISRLVVVVLCLVNLFQQAYVTKSKRAQIESQPKFNGEYVPTQVEDVVTVMFILIYLVLDFIVNTAYLDAAGQAFRDGYEFVRRKGFLLCANSRERRLIQSLQWSFSATKPNLVSVRGFFAVDKETIFNFLAISLVLWSLIIQLQEEAPGVVIVFTPNCLQKPNGRFAQMKDNENFCRKKVWTVASDVVPRTLVIIDKLNSLTSDLESKVRRRRRRRSLDTMEDLTTTFVHWKGGMVLDHSNLPKLGNCLSSKARNSSALLSYYADFHEPCFSPILNTTLLVPRLYSSGRKLWLGRRTVDCGLFPFPLPSLYEEDCAGQRIRIPEDYDDCGWRQSQADRLFLGSRATKKVWFKSPSSGRRFACWSEFYALVRCRRLEKLGILDRICPVSRDVARMNSPRDPLLKVLLNITSLVVA